MHYFGKAFIKDISRSDKFLNCVVVMILAADGVLNMSKQSSSALDDFSMVHRLCFTARVLPIELPNYWENIADFSTVLCVGKNGYSLTG